jgi:hypothetical protein
MYAQSSVITGANLAASANEAPLAAGLSWVGSTGDVGQLTLSDNVAENDGGGLFLRDATLTAGAGLASGNACDNAGAAFLLSGTSALTLTNTVLIYENVARQGAGVWLSQRVELHLERRWLAQQRSRRRLPRRQGLGADRQRRRILRRRELRDQLRRGGGVHSRHALR